MRADAWRPRAGRRRAPSNRSGRRWRRSRHGAGTPPGAARPARRSRRRDGRFRQRSENRACCLLRFRISDRAGGEGSLFPSPPALAGGDAAGRGGRPPIRQRRRRRERRACPPLSLRDISPRRQAGGEGGSLSCRWRRALDLLGKAPATRIDVGIDAAAEYSLSFVTVLRQPESGGGICRIREPLVDVWVPSGHLRGRAAAAGDARIDVIDRPAGRGADVRVLVGGLDCGLVDRVDRVRAEGAAVAVLR